MLRSQKPKEVSSIKERFETAKSVIFAENKGLKVSEVTELRKTLGKENASFKVVKNRLVKRALADAKIEGLDSYFKGPIAIASSETDAVTPAKVLVHFTKENERLEIKGGYMQGEVLSVGKIRALASLPSREELYAQLLRCLQGPARGLVTVLSAVPRSLVTVINALKDKKES